MIAVLPTHGKNTITHMQICTPFQEYFALANKVCFWKQFPDT